MPADGAALAARRGTLRVAALRAAARAGTAAAYVLLALGNVFGLNIDAHRNRGLGAGLGQNASIKVEIHHNLVEALAAVLALGRTGRFNATARLGLHVQLNVKVNSGWAERRCSRAGLIMDLNDGPLLAVSLQRFVPSHFG